jgi:hypothetical protein
LQPDRALALGFRAESSFDEIIRIHIEDEMGRRDPGLTRIWAYPTWAVTSISISISGRIS